MSITDFLLPGKQNAVSSKKLAALMGCRTVRDLQKRVEAERRKGAVILSTSERGGGYFLPGNPLEVRQFIVTLRNRAKHTLVAVKSAEELLSQLENGLDIGGD